MSVPPLEPPSKRMGAIERTSRGHRRDHKIELGQGTFSSRGASKSLPGKSKAARRQYVFVLERMRKVPGTPPDGIARPAASWRSAAARDSSRAVADGERELCKNIGAALCACASARRRPPAACRSALIRWAPLALALADSVRFGNLSMWW